MEARDRGSSRPLGTSVSKSTLGLEGSDGGASSDTQPSLPHAHRSSDPRRIESQPIQTKINRRSSSSIHPDEGRARKQRTSRPFRRRSLQGCLSVEMDYEMRTRQRLGGTWEWQDAGDVGKGEEMWLTSLEGDNGGISGRRADERCNG